MQQPQIPHPLDARGIIDLTYADRQALLDLYRIHLAAIERLECLLELPKSQPTRSERRRETRER